VTEQPAMATARSETGTRCMIARPIGPGLMTKITLLMEVTLQSSAFSRIDHAISHRPDSVVYEFVHFGL
jgi:hypothetical protein